jgi:hypothetical protein
MLQIIFLFFGILAMIYLIIIDKSMNDDNKNIISTSNIYPIDIQSINQMNSTNQINPINLITPINTINQINPIKTQILWKNNKNRKQKRKI